MLIFGDEYKYLRQTTTFLCPLPAKYTSDLMYCILTESDSSAAIETVWRLTNSKEQVILLFLFYGFRYPGIRRGSASIVYRLAVMSRLASATGLPLTLKCSCSIPLELCELNGGFSIISSNAHLSPRKDMWSSTPLNKHWQTGWWTSLPWQQAGWTPSLYCDMPVYMPRLVSTLWPVFRGIATPGSLRCHLAVIVHLL